jgi:hypothetical protein
MKSVIVEALDEVCQGYSPDRVVADPELNSQFVAACRKRGLADNVAELNRALFNLRKRRELRGRPRATRTSFADQTNYQFAAEMAIRFIERRDSVSLDDVICDPSRASEFDRLAADISRGYSPIQCCIPRTKGTRA